MTSPFRSQSDHLAIEQAQGDYPIGWNARTTPAGTVATANAGFNTGYRWVETVQTPAMGAVDGAYLIDCRAYNLLAGQALVATEWLMGTLTVSGNVFAAGSAMPSRRWHGKAAAAQTATILPKLYVATTLVATTPSFSFGYTNEQGVSGRTSGTLTLPTNALLGTTFDLSPHLQSGDFGIQSVQSMTISSGTAGSLRIYGLIPACYQVSSANQGGTNVNTMMPLPRLLHSPAGGDAIGTYRVGAATSSAMTAKATLAAETT